MTAVIAWSTFDNHGTASIYLAAESRVCRGTLTGNAGAVIRDDFQKTFWSHDTPDVFAVCGNVTRLSEVMQQFYPAVRAEREARAQAGGNLRTYTRDVVGRIPKQTALWRHEGLIVFHGYRFGTLDFGLERITFSRTPLITRIIVEPTKALLFRDGHGQTMVEREQTDDPETDARGFSRWFWQSFVSSLQKPTDPTCGGPPQLVGLYRHRNGIPYGVHFKGSVFFNGARLQEPPPLRDFEYRDELFQRTLFDRRLVDGAQKHARNFPKRNLFLVP